MSAHNVKMLSWKDALLQKATMSEPERLRREADAEERRGDRFKGCSWMGDEHPSAGYYRRAADLRRLANLLEAPQRAAEQRRAREARRHQEFVDSMREDRDF